MHAYYTMYTINMYYVYIYMYYTVDEVIIHFMFFTTLINRMVDKNLYLGVTSTNLSFGDSIPAQGNSLNLP